MSKHIMGRATLALLFAIASVACDPGALPTPPQLHEDRSDWFQADSLKPWPLDQAILDSNLIEIRSLLKQGADPNRRWGHSGDRFPLQVLLNHSGSPRPDFIETTRLLLEHGADPNARWCPFNSRGFNSPHVIRLHSTGMPYCFSKTGATALMFSAAAGLDEVVELLLNAGADPAVTDWSGNSALDYATSVVAFEHISRRLFPDVKSRDRRALLYTSGNNPASVSPLQAAFVGKNAEWYDAPVGPYDDGTADLTLRRYKETRHRRMARRIQTLIAFGADPSQPTQWQGGPTAPLLLAVVSQNTAVARVLLAHGADPNYGACEKDDSRCASGGKTLLMWAAEVGDTDTVRLLLEFKADRALRDSTGRTVMHYALGPDVWTLLEPGW